MTPKTIGLRALIVTAALALGGCASASRAPVAFPNAQAPFPPQQQRPQASLPQEQVDIRISGQAFAADRTQGVYPPNSELVVRLYDAATSVNTPLIEHRFRDGTGRLPWGYELGLRSDDFRSLQRPAVAARLVAPDGTLLYRNVQAALLVPGRPDNIPLVSAIAPATN